MHPDAVVLLPPSRLWSAWTFDPAVLAGLGAAGLLYGRGLAALRRRPAAAPPDGRARQAASARPVVSRRQAAAFFLGLACLVIALMSPLDALGGTLLSAHMAQHLILLTAAPLLLVYGRPGLVGRLGLPAGVRVGLRDLERTGAWRRAARLSRSPWAALAGVTAALWVWHLPAVYDAAVANPFLHAAEHLCFFVTSLAFWRLIVDANPRRRLGYAAGMVLSFVVMLEGAALGALIALSPQVLYPVYGSGAGLYGLTPMSDQQLAGALMWIPMGGLYLVTIVALAARWFAAQERRTPQHAAIRPAPEPIAGLVPEPIAGLVPELVAELVAEPVAPEVAR